MSFRQVKDVRGEIGDLRREMRTEFAAMRTEFSASLGTLQGMVWRVGGALIATFAAGLVAVAVRGG